MFDPITASYTPASGVRLTVDHWVAGYMRLSFCRSAISSGSAARTHDVDARSSIATIGLVFSIIGHLFVTRGATPRGIAGGSRGGTGGGERSIDDHAFGQHHVDAAPCVDLDDRERLLGKRDVVLRQTIHGAAHAGAHSSLEGLAGIRRSDLAKGRSAERGELVLNAITNAADHAREQRIGEDLALLGDE